MCWRVVDCRPCGTLVADLVVLQNFGGSSRKGAKFFERDLDRLKRRKIASLFPEEDWEDVLFVEYVSKTGCSPNPDPHLHLGHLLHLG
jgi:hypothetical protein